MKHIFGPVPSRRLGLSLGIDIVPYKTCNLDCVYCEAGRTLTKSTKRLPYVSVETILYELQASLLNKNQEIDYVTLSGAGEPTLNSDIGVMIQSIKKEIGSIPLALITNGTLFSDPEVRKEISEVNVVLPSLDAISPQAFQLINRPCETLTNSLVIEGLISLRDEFSGKIWIEVFMIPGANDSYTELSLLKKTLLKIRPDKVHLNSLDRPSAEPWVKKQTIYKMEHICDFLQPLPCEIMAKMVPKKKLAKLEREEHTREIQKHIKEFRP